MGTTTIRVPAKILLVGFGDADRDALVRDVQLDGHLPFPVPPDEALKKLQAGPFDLLLLDAHASGMDAPQFLLELRNNAEYGLIPVIMVAAADDLDTIAQCLDAGADDWLPRVFRPAMLRARLNAGLDRRRLRDTRSLRREMAVARNIQHDFLPEALPVARSVQIDAALHPARQVSGDFYDAFALPATGTIVFVVGDVCDKGVGAALFMALFRSLIRASADPVGGGAIQMIGGRRTLVRQSLESASPADLLTRVAGFTNNYIARLHGRTNMFATVFMAALDPFDGQLDYVNAGHEPALVIAPDGAVRKLKPTGVALGLHPDLEFEADQVTLERGHSLLAFTDGLLDARNPAGEVFGPNRLLDAIRAHSTSASDLVHGVVDTVHAFAGQAEPHDDLTLLAAMRTL